MGQTSDTGAAGLVFPNSSRAAWLREDTGFHSAIVRRTGGLADSVRPYDRASDAGTGFVFEHFTPEGLRWALGLALETFRDGPRWHRLVLRAMAEDFSWTRQARRYVELYERIERRRG